jgi:hypothetical protein
VQAKEFRFVVKVLRECWLWQREISEIVVWFTSSDQADRCRSAVLLNLPPLRTGVTACRNNGTSLTSFCLSDKITNRNTAYVVSR